MISFEIFLKFLVAYHKDLYLDHCLLIYTNDMTHIVLSNLLLYAVHLDLMFQHKDKDEI